MSEIATGESKQAPEVFGSGGPSTLDGKPVRSMVALSQHGPDTVAIWHVSLGGELCGAWTLPDGSEADALAILGLCDRRAVIEADGEGVDLLRQLAKTATVSLDGVQMQQRQARLGDMLSAITEARNQHRQAVADYGRKHDKRLAPLVWPHDAPASLDEMLSAAESGWSAPETPARAYVLARLAQKAIAIWSETEAVRQRREYLREQFGPAQTLPALWRDASLAAFATPFALPKAGE